MTKPTTKLKPDELLTHLHGALAVLGLTELRRALDETIAEPTKDESRLAWLWRLVEPQLRRRVTFTPNQYTPTDTARADR